MKKFVKIILPVALVLVLGSCKDEFTESIFDTTTPAVDNTKSTAKFDQWLYDNFVVPYNTEIQYKFNLTASNMDYQLAPADYKKSQILAHMNKYLFYDVYNMYGEKAMINGVKTDVFMKKYGPRIFHFIGSVAYSPTTGTETLGYASSGVKITLINVNDISDYDPEKGYTPGDVETLNRAQFHTMHHEFSHILHQTKSYPVAYGQVTPASYDGRTWQERDSVEAHCMGFTTHYASSAATEDFVEMLSCTITDTDYRWMTTIIDACLNGGMKEGDKGSVYTLIDSLGISRDKANEIVAGLGGIGLYKEYDSDGVETRDISSFHLADAKAMNSEHDKGCTYADTAYVKYDTFDEFMEARTADQTSEVKGINAILKKMEIATKWYTENYGLYLFQMRREVRYRQNHINDYLKTVEFYDLD